MFTCTAFAVIVIYNESPWFVSCLETLGDTRNSIGLRFRGAVIVVKGDINLTALVVGCLCMSCQQHFSCKASRVKLP